MLCRRSSMRFPINSSLSTKIWRICSTSTLTFSLSWSSSKRACLYTGRVGRPCWGISSASHSGCSITWSTISFTGFVWWISRASPISGKNMALTSSSRCGSHYNFWCITPIREIMTSLIWPKTRVLLSAWSKLSLLIWNNILLLHWMLKTLKISRYSLETSLPW